MLFGDADRKLVGSEQNLLALINLIKEFFNVERFPQILSAFGDKTDTQTAHYVLFINVAGYFRSHCGLRTAHCALRSGKLWGAFLGALWGRYL